ncbi:MAG: M28 family peptidase [Planctomycetes bacterium]|nr:M28 family peptidase [Planctomycetota bacterium]
MQHASASVRLAAVSLLSTVAWAAAPWQDAPVTKETPATKDAPASSEAPATQDAPAAADAPAAPPAGKIIEGAVNVYSWAPDDSAKRVEAKDIDLRKVFEDLGPVATRWYQHAITLSNPWFEGRAPGVRGNDLAAEYLEFWMKDTGLEPAFPAVGTDGVTPKDGEWTSYMQEFALTGGSPKVELAQASFGGKDLERGKDYAVLGISGTAKAEAPVTFVGYGIEKGEGGYSSYEEGADLTGRIAMVLRYEPLDDRGHSKWASRRFSEFANMSDKINAIVDRGAAGIILVAPPGVRYGKPDLEDVSTSRWGRPLDIPVVQASAELAESILKAGAPDKGSLMDWRVLADEGKVKTVALGDGSKLALETKLSVGGTPTQNVGGVLRGKGSLKDEWVVVGAHYDHVGYGYFGTSPQYTGQLHPGADDNASGTSAMLCVAQLVAERYAAKDAPADARSVLFLGFTAEESGLRGSKWFVEHPTIPGDKMSLMVNMDMVGRLRSDDLAVGGMSSAKDMVEIMRPVFERSGLVIRADPSGRGPSDHASFYGAGIPVVFIYTGNHDDYHTPKDKGYTLNPEGAAKIVGMTTDMVMTIATRPEKLEFKQGSGRSADRGYAAVRLGVMPRMDDERPEGAPNNGVMVDAVSADTSASDAGIRKDDVLLAWNGEELEGASTMMAKLRSHKPGDVVKLKVWREGKEVELDVTLRAAKPKE